MNLDNLIKNIKKQKIPTDLLGQPININDAVVYTVGTKGSGLRRGVILNILEHDNFAEVSIDTCKRKVYASDLLVINDLLRLQGISQENIINELSSTLKENKNVYLFYVINLFEKNDGILFFHPKYCKEKMFESDIYEIIEKHPNCIFIPFSKYYQIIEINKHIHNKYPDKQYNLFNLFDKLTIESNFYRTSSYLNFKSKTLLSFNLNNINHTKFKIPLNEILNFDINKDQETNEYYLDIENESFINNLFGHPQFTVKTFIYQILFYWNEFIPFINKYILYLDDDLLIENQLINHISRLKTKYDYITQFTDLKISQKYINFKSILN